MFTNIAENELMTLDGGFVITGTVVGIAVGCLAGGVAVGYAAGTIIEYFTK